MPLNLTLLRSFYAVASAGSVSGAARDGFISQPALSKAVRELERQLGVPLMERTTRGVVLTEGGRTLHEYARVIFATERAAVEALTTHRTLSGGLLRLGASTTISTYVLPKLMGQFRALHPGLTMRLQRANTRDIEAQLCAYELDVALVEGPAHSEAIVSQVWREEELVCVCGPSHPLANRDRVWPSDLATCDWVTREEGSGTREVVERALYPYGLPPASALEIGGAEALKQTVAEGLGIAVVSRVAAADQIALGKLLVLPLAEPDMRRPFYWLELSGRPLSPAARGFQSFIFGKAS